MPKMKSNSGAKKRFKLTGTGKVRRAKANKRHILTKKSTKRKRNLRHSTLVHESQEHQIKLMLPYGR
jgi:large subunit ribosomal protein L35